MDLNDFAIFRMMNGKMRWLGQRQRVLAENIANADTPKYQARELKQVNFRKTGPSNVFRIQLARTHDGHLKGVGDENEQQRAGGSDRQLHDEDRAPRNALHKAYLRRMAPAYQHQLVSGAAVETASPY